MLSDIFQLSGKETVYIAVLSALLTFSSTIVFFNAEIGQPSEPVIQYYGFPFETLKKVFTFQGGNRSFHGKISPVLIINENVEIIWSGLLINLVVYGLLSFVIVRVIVKVKEEIDFRKYDSIS